MESSDQWLQVEECGIMDSLCSSSPSMMERRVRPSPQDQALKCPRCESTHTKFCYYNNYSLSQPRYFCKACRRYWTKGGTLRNIPVGGGCRKNKKVSNKKSNVNDVVPFPQPHHDDHNLQLTTTSFPHHHHHHHQAMQIFSHPMGLMLDHPTPSEFMGTNVMNYGTTSRDLDGMGDHHVVDINGHTHNDGLLLAPNFQGFGGNLRSFDDSYNTISNNNNIISGTNYIMDSSSDANNIEDHHVAAIHDVKPNPKLLSLEWQDQGCSDAGKQPFGYISGLGSWTGMINGYGSSTTNSFV